VNSRGQVPLKKSLFTLILGDVVALAATTLIGFANHREFVAAYLPRMLAAFLPLLAGWFLIAPWLGLFSQAVVSDPRQLWRPPLAMLLGAPIAGVLRGAMLGSAVLPVFVLVLGGSSGLVLLIWRSLFHLGHRQAGS
jgi:hypothetical protein